MTEAEAISSLTAYISEVNGAYTNYIGFISAFLIMSYFAADRLNTILMYVVLTLFTLVAGNLIFVLFLLNNDLDQLYSHIITQKISGAYELPWFGLNPEWSPRVLTAIQVLSTIGGYLGCIFFFIYQRRHRKDQEGT